MTGKPGRSGGRRPRAGRPVAKFTVRMGEKFYVSGLGLSCYWAEVTALDRKRITLLTALGEITLTR